MSENNVLELVSLNQNLNPIWGFPNKISYSEDGFNGHQIGICIGILEPYKGYLLDSPKEIISNDNYKVIKNCLSESIKEEVKAGYLYSMLHNDDLVFIYYAYNTIDINEYKDDNKLKYYIEVYLPYYVKGHSVFKHTINFESIYNTSLNLFSNSKLEIYIEILLVKDNLNRYFTVKKEYNSNELKENNKKVDSIYQIVQEYLNTFDYTKPIDMYSDTGKVTYINDIHSKEDFINYINSIRLYDIKTHIPIDFKLNTEN